MAKVLVIIPTYQEAENIENVLSAVRQSLPGANVLVVDDNSPDGTVDLAEKCNEKLGNIEVLRRSGKSGLGSAYRAGFAMGLERGFEVLVEMDADMSHNPADLPRLLAPIDDQVDGGADLVVGSRYVPGGAIPGWPTHRALLSRQGNRYAAFALGLPIVDATSGYRAYRGDVLRRIDLEAVRADGYGFQIEMAYRMHTAGGTLREVPITFVDRVEGKSKMSGRIIIEALALVTVWGVKRRLGKFRLALSTGSDEAPAAMRHRQR